MKKPSRFSSLCPKLHIYDHPRPMRIRLTDRFRLSRVLLAEGEVSYHAGVDLWDSREVLVLSCWVRNEEAGDKKLRDPGQLGSNFCAKVIWHGYQRVRRVLYQFQVLQRVGSSLPECLAHIDSKDIKHFYAILILLIELVIKVQAAGANLRQINVNGLQVVGGCAGKKIQLQITNRNSIEFYVREGKNTWKGNENKGGHNGQKRLRKISHLLDKNGSRPSNRQDIRVVFQLMLALEGCFNEPAKEREGDTGGKQSRVDLAGELKKILKLLEQNQQSSENSETWLKSVLAFTKTKYSLCPQKLKQQLRPCLKKANLQQDLKFKLYLDNLQQRERERDHIDQTVDLDEGYQSQNEGEEELGEEMEEEMEEEWGVGVGNRVFQHVFLVKMNKNIRLSL